MSWNVMWYVSSSKLSSKFRTPCTCSPVSAPLPWTAVSSARKSSHVVGYTGMSLNRCCLTPIPHKARPVKENGDLQRWSCHTSQLIFFFRAISQGHIPIPIAKKASRFQSLSASAQHMSRDWHPSEDFQPFASFHHDQQDDRYTT